MTLSNEIPKVSKKSQDRCEIRAFEVIYDIPGESPDLSSLCKQLCAKSHGIYKLFSVIHSFPSPKDGKNHVHFGLVLRDKPRTLKWADLKEYFTLKGLPAPREHGALKNRSNDFDKKLQTYYNYCIDPKLHEGQTIGTPFCHKFIPKSLEEQVKPADHMIVLIRKGLSVDDLDDLIDNPDTSLKIFKEALSNHEKYTKMIEKLEEIHERKQQAKLYEAKAKTYRPFQKDLTKVLDTQDSRHVHAHHDPGNTGKNYWLDIEGMREDTLVMQSAETKRIAYVWNPKKHRRIIFDIPKNKMQYVNTSVIEKLKNGTLFSTMHYPKMKRSNFKPSIVILGNERIPNTWTEDRLTESTTDLTNFSLITTTKEGLRNRLPLPTPSVPQTLDYFGFDNAILFGALATH